MPDREDFNPRTHVGCDNRPLDERIAEFVFQSTHPRGVRLTRLRRPCFRRYFNPRTHVGCDQECKKSVGGHGNFNPRTHVGCDDKKDPSTGLWKNFNPRTHVGCD